jgi:endonuclease/exonuclease/phosphatase (EEP) superfamily protein YafD
MIPLAQREEYTESMAAKRPHESMQFRWPASVAAKPAETAADLAGRQQSTAKATSPIRRALWWGCYLAAWCIVASLVALASLRIFAFDATYVLTWLNAYTRYIYLPAYVCAAWAMWQRRWALLAVSVLLIVCHVSWMAPDFVPDRRFDPQPGVTTVSTSPTLRVFFANVKGTNREWNALLDEISAANPDIIVLVEFSWPWHIAFTKAPVMTPYKYGAGWQQWQIGSVCLFSKLPLKMEKQQWIGGRAVHTADVALGGRTLRLIGLHAPRPIAMPQHDYYWYWEQLIPKLTAEPGPLLIVGDFNATEHSRVYHQLTSGKLRSAHDDRGRGWATTWPNGKYPLPPIRIDQALISPDIECVRIVEGEGRGSDHRPLVIDLRIRE